MDMLYHKTHHSMMIVLINLKKLFLMKYSRHQVIQKMGSHWNYF